MNEIKKNDAKSANLAWRKKPRRFAPKSRLGCKTCKIRRVKCDLSQPSCLKCQSTGRTCDGYSELPLPSKTGIESDHAKVDTVDSYFGCILRSKDCNPVWPRIRPLMMLPITGSTQADASLFFESITIKHLNGHQPCYNWRNTLLFYFQTVPSVRHAAIALALVHRNYLERNSGGREHREQSLGECSPDRMPLLYYNRAIQLLMAQSHGDSNQTSAITLLVCYLFICFDNLAGNYVQAGKHLRGGVELARHIDKALVGESGNSGYSKTSEARALVAQVKRQIRRLDTEAAVFLVDWTPTDIEDAHLPQLSPVDSIFRSMEEASDNLQILIAWAMRLRWADQQVSPYIEVSPSPLKSVVLGQLEAWSNLFEALLLGDCCPETDPESFPLVSLMRLQQTTIWIHLSSYGPGREMEYDTFLPQFRRCVLLASEVAEAHQRYSGPFRSTFSPEIGFIPVLFLIGAKCRDPVLRREALGILRRQPMREAVWDSIATARVIERVIEIEEGWRGKEGMPRSMEQIAMRERIETMSWEHVINRHSVARLEFQYTLCAQEEVHIESLSIEGSNMQST